jgi:hypothetical protein
MIILRKKASPPPLPNLIPNVVFSFSGITVNAGSPANVTNGSGLTPATPSLSGIHENYTISNGVRSALVNNIWPRILLFTLPAVYWVDGLSFWQVTGAEFDSGIRNFTLEYSLDGLSGWLQIPGSPTTFVRGSNNIASGPLQFSWTPVNASYIRFVVTNSWGSQRIALLEVQFRGYL